MKTLYSLLLACCFTSANAQYAPQVGLTGCTAIAASSPLFTGWANVCSIQRGFKNIADPSQGYASVGDSSAAIGAANGTIVSLGDSGIATLTFAAPLFNGPGADFAVFENGFINMDDATEAFLELAFVEVSSDGIHYYRFPANSLTQATTQLGNANYITARNINNLAGKYLASWGTPFDLQELAGTDGLDIDRITHIRIIDVIGDIDTHASYDSKDRPINDPYPTVFPSGGFDLDAVGAIHQATTAGISMTDYRLALSVYPNPATDHITVVVTGTAPAQLQYTLTSVTGVVLQQAALSLPRCTIAVSQLPAGMYYLVLHDANGNKWVEKITKR